MSASCVKQDERSLRAEVLAFLAMAMDRPEILLTLWDRRSDRFQVKVRVELGRESDAR